VSNTASAGTGLYAGPTSAFGIFWVRQHLCSPHALVSTGMLSLIRLQYISSHRHIAFVSTFAQLGLHFVLSYFSYLETEYTCRHETNLYY
jgi:hypothetical protein